MNGFNPYLANVLSAMQPDPAAPPAPSTYGPYQPNMGAPNYQPNPGLEGQPIAAPPAPAPPGILSRAGSAVAHAFSSPDPIVQPGHGPLPPKPVDLGDVDAPDFAPPAPPTPAAPPAAEVPTGPVGPPPPPDVGGQALQPDFPLQLAGGSGVIPAHEVEMRGPTLRAAQGAANEATAGAVGNVAGRGQELAAREYDVALQQERSARAREAAWEQSQAEREEEMVQRQNDFDQSVKTLSQSAVDPNRFWATRSTGQKVSALVGLALGGFLQGARGGSNPGLDAINTAIDRDVRAQELAYHVARDVVSGRQTAFSMAMQKYQNADAARAMARAAGMDAVQAQMAQAQALGKGTDAANRADIAMAALQTDKMNQIAQGVRFILPQSTGPVWRDKYGIPYNADQARGVANTTRASEEKHEEIGLNTAGDILKEQAKASAEGGADGLGKEGRQKLALEEKKAEQERDANLKAINNAKANLPAIVEGSALGTLAAKALPSGAPGVTSAVNSMNTREAYNNRAMLAVAAAYKLSTDATEPKNLTILEHYSTPYVIRSTDNEEVARAKMNSLQKLVTESAAAKGTAPPVQKKMPTSTTYHGGK